MMHSLSVCFLCLASVAVGNPLPQITWTLDRSPLSEAWHVRVGDYVTDVYTVNSYVNISAAKVEDGGLYACTARNSAGLVSRSARVNVRGRPFIRFMANVTALSGQSLDLYCPYSGYPVQGIHWIKGTHLRQRLRIGKRQQIACCCTDLVANRKLFLLAFPCYVPRLLFDGATAAAAPSVFVHVSPSAIDFRSGFWAVKPSRDAGHVCR